MVLISALLVMGMTDGLAESTKVDDPLGVLLKPIPDRLVVLTFDDACKSHATFVGPLLKKYGFGATFYITRFGNPALSQDNYMSWQEIKALEDMGFEIGNHTWSHSQMGGDAIPKVMPGDVTKIEELFLANKIARPVTFCWPIYSTSRGVSSLLSETGYLFGRSGGSNDRPYMPTVENPFKTPSFTILLKTPVETFINAAKRAVRGRIPIYTFHGVPDIEHPSVGVEPARFEEMMKYLKDNNYTVIAMRDIAKYVDARKAMKLLPVPVVNPDITITDTAQLSGNRKFESSNVVCQVTVQGDKITFSGTGAGRVMVDGTINGNVSLVHSAPYVLELLPRSGVNALKDISVHGSVLRITPQGLNGAPLTLQNATLKLQDPLNTWKDFSGPVTLVGANTIQSLDSCRAVMTAKMTGSGSVTYTGFHPIGHVSSDSDYTGNTRIAQDEWFGQNPDDRQGHDDLMFGISGTRPFGTGTLTIAGKVGTRMGRAWFGGEKNVIPNAVVLESALVFNGNSAIDMAGVISGRGSLVKVFNAKDTGSELKLRGDNSYSGGTRFFSGNLLIYNANSLGTGPVTLGGKSSDARHAMSLCNQAAMTVANAIELAGITDAIVGGTCPTFTGIRGDVVNNHAAATEFNTAGGDLTLSGAISGNGGLFKTGANSLILAGVNSYTGPTTVEKGTLCLKNARSLGNKTDVFISEGAAIEVNFDGEVPVNKLFFGWKLQPPGKYTAKNASSYIKGKGTVKSQ